MVVEYDPNWLHIFEQLHARVWPAVSDLALSVEHVGSTSVPGLAAKPVIDLNVVARSEQDVPALIERLATLGYVHRGNLGIEGREAFYQPADLPRHHLYLSPQGSLGLRNHLTVRDHLRANPAIAREYGELKRRLARAFPDDIDGYIDGKTDFIVGILRRAGLHPEQVSSIEAANKKA